MGRVKGGKERFEEGRREHGLNELEMSQCVMLRDNSSVGCCVNYLLSFSVNVMYAK